MSLFSLSELDLRRMILDVIRIFLFFFLFGSFVFAAEPLPLPKDTPWDMEVLQKVPEFKWVNQKGGVHSVQII